MKQYLVIGLGHFGSKVAVELKNLGEQVFALDIDEKKVKAIKEAVTETMIGDARDGQVLSQFVGRGVETAILNLGENNLEASALATLELVKLGIKRIIAKAGNEVFGKILRAIGATDVIYPEQEGARLLAQRLHSPNLIEHIPLSPEYDIVELAVPDDFVGKPLGEVKLHDKYGVVVIAVKDVMSGEFALVPGADYEFRPDSAMLIIGRREDIDRLPI